MARRFVTPEEHEAICSLYKSGFSESEVCAIVDRPRRTVQNRLNLGGVKRRKSGGQPGFQLLANTDIEKTVFLYTEMKMSIRQISNTLNITEGAVRYRLDLAGVKRRTVTEGLLLAYERGDKQAPYRKHGARRYQNGHFRGKD